MKRVFEIETEDRCDFDAGWLRMLLTTRDWHDGAIMVREIQPGPTPEQQAVLSAAIAWYASACEAGRYSRANSHLGFAVRKMLDAK